MNPGDVYRPPSGNSQRPSDPYAPPAPYNPYPPAPTPSGNNRYQTPSPNPYQSHQSPPPNQNPYQSPPPHHSAPPPVPQNPFQHPLEADAGQYNSHAAPLPTSPSLNSVYNIPPSFSGLAPQYSTGDMSYPPQNHTPGPGQEDDDAAFPLLNNGAPNIGMRPSPSPGPGYGGPPTFAPYNGQQFSDQPMDSPYAQDESLIRYGPLPARVQRRRTKRVKHK
jgi:hypothetical protein